MLSGSGRLATKRYGSRQDAAELKRRMEKMSAIIKGFGSALENAFLDTVIEKNDLDAQADFIERVAESFDPKNHNGSDD